jgi:hypothetical protein
VSMGAAHPVRSRSGRSSWVSDLPHSEGLSFPSALLDFYSSRSSVTSYPIARPRFRCRWAIQRSHPHRVVSDLSFQLGNSEVNRLNDLRGPLASLEKVRKGLGCRLPAG